MTTFEGQEKPSLEDVLEHHGVKGMKWGVRRENRLQLNQRVASGSGSKLDKARVALTQVSADHVKKAGGLDKAAGDKVRELQGRKARIQKGQATARDMLALHGGDRLHDSSFKTSNPSAKPVRDAQQTKLHERRMAAGKAALKVGLAAAGAATLALPIGKAFTG